MICLLVILMLATFVVFQKPYILSRIRRAFALARKVTGQTLGGKMNGGMFLLNIKVTTIAVYFVTDLSFFACSPFLAILTRISH